MMEVWQHSPKITKAFDCEAKFTRYVYPRTYQIIITLQISMHVPNHCVDANTRTHTILPHEHIHPCPQQNTIETHNKIVQHTFRRMQNVNNWKEVSYDRMR